MIAVLRGLWHPRNRPLFVQETESRGINSHGVLGGKQHAVGNTVEQDGRWVPAFPNARYLMPKAEFDYWSKK